jgi:hypothetical protein
VPGFGEAFAPDDLRVVILSEQGGFAQGSLYRRELPRTIEGAILMPLRRGMAG